MSGRGRNVPKNRLGRSLQKQQKQKVGQVNDSGELVLGYVVDKESKRNKQESILDQSDMQAVLEYSTKVTVEKQRAVIITKDSYLKEYYDPVKIETMDKHWNDLTIPKRPQWDNSWTKEQLVEKEKEVFFEWRRSISELEANEHLCITPFEKNLEVWRQLWRVVERSEVVVQIVDARNPLLFRSIDLEKWCKQLGKKTIILLNKADLLNEKQRQYWANFFKGEGLGYIFFSAKIETIKNENLDSDDEDESEDEDSEDGDEQQQVKEENVKEKAVETKEKVDSDDDEDDEGDEDSDEDDSEEDNEYLGKVKSMRPKKAKKGKAEEDEEDSDNEDYEENVKKALPRIDGVVYGQTKRKLVIPEGFQIIPEDVELLGSELLIKRLIQECSDLGKLVSGKATRDYVEDPDKKFTIGMVGYPNVGKSSTINALCGCKRVQVSQTPGKTKHFQTIIMPNTPLTLCDCPGLVFPSFMSTKNEMYCNGLLRIANVRDIHGPVSIVCREIPKAILEHVYRVTLPLPKEHEGEDPDRCPTSIELLERFSYIKGFLTKLALPDMTRGGRIVLADYVSGKLLHVTPPPKISRDLFAPYEEQLAAHGIDQDDVVKDQEEGKGRLEQEAQQEEKKVDDSFALLESVNEGGSDYDKTYMHHKLQDGHKFQRRLKEKKKYESGGIYNTDNIHRKKKGHYDSSPSLRNAMPVSVRATAAKDQINLQVSKK
jgi:large subunit GTPase 1